MLQLSISLVIRLLSKVRPRNRTKEMHNSRQTSSNLNPLLDSILEYQLGDIIRTTRRLQSTTCISKNN